MKLLKDLLKKTINIAQLYKIIQLMLTINETTGSKEYYYDLVRGIVYSNNNYIEFGYFEKDESLPKTYYDGQWYYDLRKNLNVIKIFSVTEGRELKFTSYHPSIANHKNVFGCGAFPYSIEREYGAEKHLKEFKNTVKISNEHTISYAKELNYSLVLNLKQQLDIYLNKIVLI